MKINFKAALVVVCLLNTFLLLGCQNTAEGFGKDMQHAGKEIQDTVNGK